MKKRAPLPSGSTYLLVPILLFFPLLIIAVLRSPSLITQAGIGSAVIVATPLILTTYALMTVAIAGRGNVDLSVGPLLSFINVTLIQLHGVHAISSPLAVFVYVIVIGIVYQLIMGLIIIYIRIQPIIVALSGYLALSGINLVIMPRAGGTAPDWLSSWGAGTSIFSPVFLILAICTAGWLIFSKTAFCGHVRMMGYDERAAYTSGVRITPVRLGAHLIAGILMGLAALTVTSLIGSGDPTQGATYTLTAITAMVLGGASLAGGRGGVIGSLLGAVDVFLIGYVLSTFDFGGVQGFVTQLAYGLILVLSLLVSVALPFIQRRIPYVSPFLVFVVLAVIFSGVMLHAKYDFGPHNVGQQQVKTSGKHEAVYWENSAVSIQNRVRNPLCFVQGDQGLHFALSENQKTVGLIILVLIAVFAALRLAVAEAKTQIMTPFIYVSLLIIIVVAVYLLTASYVHVSAMPPVRSG